MLLNNDTINLGDVLNDFKSFSSLLDPESKGIAIGNSDVIRNAHNSFARTDPFIQDESSKSGDGVAYHFIAYVPINGIVYELDGLKNGPIYIGDVDGDDWLAVVRPAIEERIQRYSSSEVLFNLLTVCEKRSVLIENDITKITQELAQIDIDIISNPDLIIQKELRLSELDTLRNELADENAKHERNRNENTRRRHNYIPLIIHLMKALAKSNKLNGIVNEAKARNDAKKL